MSLSVLCRCGVPVPVSAEMAGLSIICPHCRALLNVPLALGATKPTVPLLDGIDSFECQEVADEEVCPGCRARLGVETVVCVRCGYNRRIGRRMKLETEKQASKPKAHVPTSGEDDGLPAWVYALGLIGVVAAMGLAHSASGPVLITVGIGMMIVGMVMTVLTSERPGIALLSILLFGLLSGFFLVRPRLGLSVLMVCGALLVMVGALKSREPAPAQPPPAGQRLNWQERKPVEGRTNSAHDTSMTFFLAGAPEFQKTCPTFWVSKEISFSSGRCPLAFRQS